MAKGAPWSSIKSIGDFCRGLEILVGKMMLFRKSIGFCSFLFLSFASFSSLSGCANSEATLRNAGPAVVVVAARPDPDQPEPLFAVDLYIRDLERDPVDLSVGLWRESGEREEALVLTTPGHGRRGLSSQPDKPGVWHRVYVDLSAVPEDEDIFLEIESVDSMGSEGLPTATAVFKPATGWSL